MTEDGEFKIYEQCPACNEKRYREKGREDVFEYIEIGDHKIVELYNKVASKFNDVMWTIHSMLTAGCWCSKHPWWVNRISHRMFLRMPWKYARMIIPRMKHWPTILEGNFLLRCNVCRIVILADDPRDYVGIEFEEADE
jgi:hypothetical protein